MIGIHSEPVQIKTYPKRIPNTVLGRNPKNCRCMALNNMDEMITARWLFFNPSNNNCNTTPLKSSSSPRAARKAIINRLTSNPPIVSTSRKASVSSFALSSLLLIQSFYSLQKLRQAHLFIYNHHPVNGRD